MTTAIQKGIEDYKVITITHKTTSIQRLKDYFVDEDGDPDYPARRLAELKESFRMKELLYLNTCNRVTFFFVSSETIGHDYLANLFHFINPVLKDDLVEKHIEVTQVYGGLEALEHFFSVAASLDSLIVGEREILGQIRYAYERSKAAGLSGDSIRLAVERAVVFAKRIYHETRIGEKPVSVVSLAFRQLIEHIPHHDTGILMIGAGQTNQQLASFLKKHNFSNVHVFNRSLERAEDIAAKTGGKAYELQQLSDFREEFQIVVSCTGANAHVLGLEDFQRITEGRQHNYTMLDLAVPGDIDPRIVEQYDVNYLDVSSLEQQARLNMDFRQREVVRALAILSDYIAEYEHVYRTRQLELALAKIPEEVKALKDKALNEVFGKDIDQLDDRSKKVLGEVLQYFEKKYIGIPMKIAKRTILDLDNFRE
jgi:glutamyl-tRNA reductase